VYSRIVVAAQRQTLFIIAISGDHTGHPTYTLAALHRYSTGPLTAKYLW